MLVEKADPQLICVGLKFQWRHDWRSLFFKKALLCRVRRAMDGANHSDFRMISPEFMASKQKLPQMDLHSGYVKIDLENDHLLRGFTH